MHQRFRATAEITAPGEHLQGLSPRARLENVERQGPIKPKTARAQAEQLEQVDYGT
ncbi:MAG TPA: hypothetical protein VMG10_15135 [Gemmataceae bacterium]|nr:hypothetical protein [Gemmataceae bacterium]